MRDREEIRSWKTFGSTIEGDCLTKASITVLREKEKNKQPQVEAWESFGDNNLGTQLVERSSSSTTSRSSSKPRPETMDREERPSRSSSRVPRTSSSRSRSRNPGTKNRRQLDLEDLERELLNALGESAKSGGAEDDFDSDSDEELKLPVPLADEVTDRVPRSTSRSSSRSTSKARDDDVHSITIPTGQRSLSTVPRVRDDYKADTRGSSVRPRPREHDLDVAPGARSHSVARVRDGGDERVPKSRGASLARRPDRERERDRDGNRSEVNNGGEEREGRGLSKRDGGSDKRSASRSVSRARKLDKEMDGDRERDRDRAGRSNRSESRVRDPDQERDRGNRRNREQDRDDNNENAEGRVSRAQQQDRAPPNRGSSRAPRERDRETENTPPQQAPVAQKPPALENRPAASPPAVDDEDEQPPFSSMNELGDLGKKAKTTGGEGEAQGEGGGEKGDCAVA